MKTTRSILVGLLATGLLAVPGAALAGSPKAGAHPGPTPTSGAHPSAAYKTSIRYLPYGHVHSSGVTMHVTGQVVGYAQGHKGAIPDVEVKLYRMLDGNTSWVYMGSATTDSGDFPEFVIASVTRQNAHYKVVFAGNATFAPSSKVTWLTVFRSFKGTITDGPGAANIVGNVSPYYTHKSISLQKKTCSTCSFVTYQTTTTGDDGSYTFPLPAPDSGLWWWRLTIPGTVAFMPSFGATYSTQWSS